MSKFEIGMHKSYIKDYPGFKHLIDLNLLSSQVMLTCEGFQKRDSKTGKYKIQIEREEKKSVDAVMKEIEDSKDKIIINTNYFNEINIINKKNKEIFFMFLNFNLNI